MTNNRMSLILLPLRDTSLVIMTRFFQHYNSYIVQFNNEDWFNALEESMSNR